MFTTLIVADLANSQRYLKFNQRSYNLISRSLVIKNNIIFKQLNLHKVNIKLKFSENKSKYE